MHKDSSSYVGYQLFFVNKVVSFVDILPFNTKMTSKFVTQCSKVALCTSGTVAVELQLAGLPCLVAYRAHLLTEWIIRYKAKVPYISIPNILLDSPIIPEALFGKCTPSELAPLLK